MNEPKAGHVLSGNHPVYKVLLTRFGYIVIDTEIWEVRYSRNKWGRHTRVNDVAIGQRIIVSTEWRRWVAVSAPDPGPITKEIIDLVNNHKDFLIE